MGARPDNKWAVQVAIDKGYRATAEGDVISSKGYKRKLSKESTGYLSFTIRVPGRVNRRIPVHKLIALQKYGEAYKQPGIVARHIDCNSMNNTWDNIVIGTQSDNMFDQDPAERQRHARVAAKARRSLTDDQVKRLKARRAEGALYKDLTAEFGIPKSSVSYILNGKTYADRPLQGNKETS